MAVEGPRLQPCGQLLRLGGVVGLDAGPPHLPRPEGNVLSQTQPAGALRTHEGLVSGETEQVDLLGLHVDRQDSRRLGGVHKKDQAVGMGDGPHPANIHGVSGEVGGMGADDGPRLRADQPPELTVVDPPLPVSRDETERHAPLRLQPVQGTQNGIVLQIRGDHMVAGVQQAADGHVQGLRGVGGEHHMVRPGTVEECCQLFPGAVDHPGSGQTPLVGATGTVAQGGHSRHHRVDHRLGLLAGGGGVVQIDHGLMTFPAAASVSAMAYILVMLPTARVSFSL